MANELNTIRDQLISRAAINPLDEVPTQLPSTQSLPNQAPVLDEVKAGNFKDLGKAFSNISDMLSNPAVIKGLASFGVSISGREDALSEFAINSAESIARNNFASDLQAGLSPTEARTAGLSSEGRNNELALFRISQQDAKAEEQRQIDNQVTQQKLDQAEEGLSLDRRQISIREKLADSQISETEFVNTLKEKQLNLEADKLSQNAKEIQIDAQRARFQNMVDAARARALDKDTNSTSSDIKLADLAKIRDQFIENINGEVETLTFEREELEADLKALENKKGPIARFFTGGDSQEVQEAREAIQSRIDEIDLSVQGYKSKIDELINDTVNDLGGKPNIIGIDSGSSSSSTASPATTTSSNASNTKESTPVVDVNTPFSSVPNGTLFKASPAMEAALKSRGLTGNLFYKNDKGEIVQAEEAI